MQSLKLLGLSTLFAVSASLSAEETFHYDYATVLEAKPIMAMVEMSTSRQECRPQVVQYRQRQQNSGNKIAGTILGAAIGHALGHRSRHRTGATVAGALIGNSVASNGKMVTTEQVEQRCHTVPVTWKEEQIVGYQVVYRYNDKTFETRMSYNPGSSMKIRVALTPIAPAYDEAPIHESDYD